MSCNYYRRLWMAVRSVEIARRTWLDTLADCFLAYDRLDGILLWPDGRDYELPDIDEVFNSDDTSLRWFGYFFATADDTHQNPLHRSRKLERLRLLDLYFRIE